LFGEEPSQMGMRSKPLSSSTICEIFMGHCPLAPNI